LAKRINVSRTDTLLGGTVELDFYVVSFQSFEQQFWSFKEF
jgi:hypothetical protein